MEELKEKLVEIYRKRLMDISSSPSFKGIRDHLDNVLVFVERMVSAYRDSECLGRLHERLKKEGNITDREATLLEVSAYLIVNEGMICNLIDFICYILILDEQKSFVSVKRKYVTDITKIAKVGMFSKINFLNQHGFKELTKHYDSTFRNDIAHHNYIIDNEGALWIREKKINMRSVSEKTNVLLNFFDDLLSRLRLKKLDIGKK